MDSEGEDYYYSDMDDDDVDDDVVDDVVDEDDVDDDDDVVDVVVDDVVDDDVDDDDDDSSLSRHKEYTILSEGDIRKRQEDDISKACSVLSVSRDQACMLLLGHNWIVSNAHEAWFDDEEKVCKALGILKESDIISLKARKLVCGICFDKYKRKRIKSTGCGHPFCKACWKTYISISINDGPGCLALRCPDPSCNVAVGESMINDLASDEDKKKYHHHLLRSYTEGNKKTKWCPAPGCDFSIEFEVGAENYDVTCSCSYGFCWNCTEEGHRPVDCETVSKWILKNSAESENTNWILANSKPCPKCKRPIEKNHGCMHMRCSPPCKFEFCWLCLDDWSTHGEKTGGFYACNRYETAKQQGNYDKVERRREMAKKCLERYTHYYERWSSNQSSRLKAIADLNKMQTVQLAEVSHKICCTEKQLKFVIEAWEQIIECRRVLKWTYAYGYYIPEEEDVKRQFFEYLQGEAESGLERLHQCAENELQSYLTDNASKYMFSNFRIKLEELTSTTGRYFENLVKALENGLSDVTHVASSKAVSSKSHGESSKGGKKKKWSCDYCRFKNRRNSISCESCNISRS